MKNLKPLTEKEQELATRLREECRTAVDKAPRHVLEEVTMSLIAIYATDQAVGPLSLEAVKYMVSKTLLLAMSYGLLENLKCDNESERITRPSPRVEDPSAN